MFSSNSVGLGGASKPINLVTKEEAPSGPPQSVRVEPVSATELRVTWQVRLKKDYLSCIILDALIYFDPSHII